MSKHYNNFQCHNLRLKLADKVLFNDFNFQFEGPGIVKIEGENGSGKSTLLKVFAGLLNSEKGNITYSGNPVSVLRQNEFSFFSTTSLGLLSDMSGREHIELISKSLKINSLEVEMKINKFKELAIFHEVLAKKVADFSQGMKQLLRLFLHLFFSPKVLFLDEPFLFLSPMIKEFVQEEVLSLASGSIVFITDQKFSWNPSITQKLLKLGEF